MHASGDGCPQNHDSVTTRGKEGLWKGEEQLANDKLAGARAHFFTFDAAFAYAAKLRRHADLDHLLRHARPFPCCIRGAIKMASESVIYVPPAAVRFGLTVSSLLRGRVFLAEDIESRGHSVRREDGDVGLWAVIYDRCTGVPERFVDCMSSALNEPHL